MRTCCGEDALDTIRLWMKLARFPRYSGGARRHHGGSRRGRYRAVGLRQARSSRLWASSAAPRVAARSLQHRHRWLSIPTDRLVEGAPLRRGRRYPRLKLEVGSPTSARISPGSRRCARRADRHHHRRRRQRQMDLPTCLRFCRGAERLDLFWLEEPGGTTTSPAKRARPGDDDSRRPRRAAYTADAFNAFMDAGRSTTSSPTSPASAASPST